MADSNPVVVASKDTTKSVKVDKGESLMDIFTTEDINDSYLSTLSKDLGDVSIYSLLEQSRQVAQDIKLR